MDKYFVRNFEYDSLLENFMVSAVVTILVTRSYLIATGFPQIGGNGLHISHMLWGGLLMLIALMMLYTLFGRTLTQLSSLIAGAGFGLFIDELGKFITSDNNYFFQPTFSLIYIIFILLYLIFESIGRRKYTEKEYLINSLELIKEAVLNDLSFDEKKMGLKYLAKADKTDQLTQIISQTYQKLKTVNPGRLNKLAKYKDNISSFYLKIVQKKWFVTILNLIFILNAIGTFLGAILLIFGVGLVLFALQIPGVPVDMSISTADIIYFTASTLAGFLVVAGILKIRRSRLAAYQLFKKYILISIFVIQVLAFYENQLFAVFGLTLDILILVALNYMIDKEKLVLNTKNA